MVDANYVYPDIARYTDTILVVVLETSYSSVEDRDANLAD
jgi:hypothetical protein